MTNEVRRQKAGVRRELVAEIPLVLSAEASAKAEIVIN